MFRNKTPIVQAAAILAALTAAAGAQSPRHRHASRAAQVYANERPPLTVTRRSFLDPGPIAPAGKTAPNYVLMGTILNQTPDQVFARSEFMNEVLPLRFDVPGRPSPLIEFATPAYPYWP